jgi:hypothetical protein
MLSSLQTSFDATVTQDGESFPVVVYYHWDGAEAEVLAVMRPLGDGRGAGVRDVLGDLSHETQLDLTERAEADARGLIEALAERE